VPARWDFARGGPAVETHRAGVSWMPPSSISRRTDAGQRWVLFGQGGDKVGSPRADLTLRWSDPPDFARLTSPRSKRRSASGSQTSSGRLSADSVQQEILELDRTDYPFRNDRSSRGRRGALSSSLRARSCMSTTRSDEPGQGGFDFLTTSIGSPDASSEES